MNTRIVVLALAAIALMLGSAFGLDWFTVEGAKGLGLSESNGIFGDTAMWSAVLFALIVLVEMGGGILGYEVPMKRVRWGYGVGSSALLCSLAIAYMMPPEVKNAIVHRTWAPALMMIGTILGIAAGYYASGGGQSDQLGEYKPIVIAGSEPRPERIPTPQGMKPLAHKLNYIAITAQLTKAGIEARRENGREQLTMWRDMIGVVVRRMPSEYDGIAFIDLVSTAGATLRLVPWTRYTGEAIANDTRALAKQLVAWCQRATLDPATRTYLEGTGEPAQLPTLALLAAHDEKLA